jgi:hypothetical protein
LFLTKTMQSKDYSTQDISPAAAESRYDLTDIELILSDAIHGALDRLRKNPVSGPGPVIEDMRTKCTGSHHINMEVRVMSQCLSHEDVGNLHLGTQCLEDLKKARALVSFAMGLIRKSRPQYYDQYAIQALDPRTPSGKIPIFEMCDSAMRKQWELFESKYFDTIGRESGRGLMHPSTDAASNWCSDQNFLMDCVYLTLDQYNNGSNSFVTIDLFGLGLMEFRYLVSGTTYLVAGCKYTVNRNGRLTILASSLEKHPDPRIMVIDGKIKEIQDQIEKLIHRVEELKIDRAKFTNKKN